MTRYTLREPGSLIELYVARGPASDTTRKALLHDLQPESRRDVATGHPVRTQLAFTPGEYSNTIAVSKSAAPATVLSVTASLLKMPKAKISKIVTPTISG